MLNGKSTFLVIPALVVALFLAAPSESRAASSLCGPDLTCICIYWTTDSGGYLEQRCSGDSGWTTQPAPPPLPGDGSWGGTGGATNPSTAPGNPLPIEVSFKVENASGAAARKVHGERIYDDGTKKWVYVPTKCTDLFYGSKFSQEGWSLLSSYIVFRGGEGVEDSHGVVQCNTGVSAWTECCNHGKYVFVCDRFAGLPSNTQQAILIHEAMHVAGQTEDLGGGTGPGNPPSAAEITAAVKAACGL